MFTAVPLHCSTGILIGAALARRKFLSAYDMDHFWHALGLPICIHGCYDFTAFTASGADVTWPVPFLFLILILAMLGGRYRLLQLERVPCVDVHKLAEAHRVWKPEEYDTDPGNLGGVKIWRNLETGQVLKEPPPMLMEFPCMCCLDVCCNCCME